MTLPDLTIEQARELAAGAFGKTILRTAGSYTVPICWPRSLDGEGVHLANGTAFFVKTPTFLFGVTAAHVVRAFLEDKERDPRILCGLLDTDIQIDLERDLIGLGKKVDIATFRVTEENIVRLNRQIDELNRQGVSMEKKQPLTAWPPRTPQVGKGVLYAGFPGSVRNRLGPCEFSFGLCPGAGVADHVDDHQIVTAIKREELVDTLGNGLPPEDFDFGGMSGGPVLAVIETGVYSWNLAGVIRKGSRLGGGMLIAAHATCLQDDGTLQPPVARRAPATSSPGQSLISAGAHTSR
jgi:hypothetical protein